MIYLCIPSHNEAGTIGLLLWKIRQVMTSSKQEYQLLVGDDGSTDNTAEVLQPYARMLPLTVVRHATRQGYAATAEALLRTAVERTDRPRRDCAILLQADFTHSPDALLELVRHIEGGADLVVAEALPSGEPSRARRWLRRFGSTLLRSRVGVPGVKDVISGYAAFRLAALKSAFRSQEGHLLVTEGWAANAELIGRVARHARRIETVKTIERHDLRQRESRRQAWATLNELWSARSALRLPPFDSSREPESAVPPEPRTANA